jgi:hypothetical protein
VTTTTLNITARRIYSDATGTFQEFTGITATPVAGYSNNYAEPLTSLLEFTLPSDFQGATVNAATLEAAITEYGEYDTCLKTVLGIPNTSASFASIDYETVALHFGARYIVGSGYMSYYGGTYDAELAGTGAESVSLNLLTALNAAIAAGHTAGGKLIIVWRRQDYDPGTFGDGWHEGDWSIDLDYTPTPLSLSGPSIVRVGGTISKSVHRTGSTASDLVVTLSQSPSGRLTIPTPETILAGNTSKAFDVTGLTEGSVTLTATAGADEAEESLTVLPALSTEPLADGLLSYWPLDEASATSNAIDRHGANDLTQVLGPYVATGKISGGRDFESTVAQHFNGGNILSLGDTDFTFQAWVKFESLTGYPAIISRWDYAGSKREYTLEATVATNQFQWYVFGTSAVSLYASNFGTITTGVWYLVHCWHDATNNQIGISVNAGTPNTLSHSAGVAQYTTDFMLGRLTTNDSSSLLDGVLDEVAVWNRVLTSAERTQLYNGGNGLAYPLTVASGISPAILFHRQQMLGLT